MKVSTADAKIAIAGIAPFSTDPSVVPTACGAAAAAKKAGVTWSWGGPPTGDISEEVADLNSALLKKPAGVLLLPLSPTAFVLPVKQLAAQGVPVVMTDGALTPSVEYQSYTSNYAGIVSQEIQKIVTDDPSKGAVGVVALAAGQPLDAEKWVPVVAGLKKHGFSVLSTQYSDGDTSKSDQEAAAMIQANPDLKVIIATSGPSAAGVASAVLAAGKKGQIRIVSVDATPQVVQLIKNGTVDFAVAQSPYLKGQFAMNALISYIRKHGVRHGKVVPNKHQVLEVPVKIITKSNLNTKLAREYLESANCSFYKS